MMTLRADEDPQVGETALSREVGLIGLGKMGTNLARQLTRKGRRVVAFNRTASVTKELEKEGIEGVETLPELVKRLHAPRVVWLMVPAGTPTEEMLSGENGIAQLLHKGDIVIDGGNALYKDSIRRSASLKQRGIHFIDVGVSGGPSGALHGASLMIGGERRIFEQLEPLFADLAVPHGYQFFDGPGAGHFVKMVHNGIEYGMMQAIAEGFTILKKSRYQLDLRRVADVYNHGSVIESRLVEWLKKAFELHGEELRGVSGTVGRTGEGEWTVKTAEELEAKAEVIGEALKFRVESEKHPSYTGRILSALREQFGGHGVHRTEDR
jgi:6-phosphogluconate dehydrogenase